MLLSTGGFSFNLPLLSISSLGGLSWSFGLNYLSTYEVNGLVGKNFNYPQNLHFAETMSGDADLISGTNTVEGFNDTGSGYEAAFDNNTRAELERSGTGSDDEFTMRSSDGVESTFYGFDGAIGTPGRPKSIRDRNGNELTYAWTTISGVVVLSSVTDSYGRTVQYRYGGSGSGAGSTSSSSSSSSSGPLRLREIEDFLGRKLNFQYDSDGRLTAVVTPSILRAAEGNTFPGGTAYVFEYDVDNTEPDRRDDLIRIWYPNQTAPYVDEDTRTVDVDAVYQNATPRYFVEYGQNSGDPNTWGRVIRETVGNVTAGVGGTYQYAYTTSGLPTNIIDGSDPIVLQTTVTDRNGNEHVYGFTAAGTAARTETVRNRDKISIPSLTTFPGYVTWTKYNQHNQPLVVVFPEGNSIEYEYEDGNVTGIGYYNRRNGLTLVETQKPGNSIGIPSRAGSNGQTELTTRNFYDPIFNQVCATIERRGNPISGTSTYFTPQNDGTTPTNADRTRYATITFFDYQKDTAATVTSDTDLQALLNLAAGDIQDLIDHVDTQMKATDGSGGLPDGFDLNLGDINGDGTGNGSASGLPAARHAGHVVKVKLPSVRLIGATSITTQVREELYTTNDRGQTTTHTNPEGNLTVFTYYPYSDPEGDGRFIEPGLGNKQYGRAKEIHVDADPDGVMSLIGEDGDLVDFIPGKITRSNTPGVYQDLVTRFEGGSGQGCASCAYDALGNPLAETDPRGFTTHIDRNELGEILLTTSPVPYEYKVETYFDANRNVTRVDKEDQIIRFDSDDPTSPCYAQFTLSGSSSTAHVPMKPGPGGSVRPGWFTNLYEFDLLDNITEEDIDATGSNPSSLVTVYEYDANENLIKTTKPDGNTVENDFDERDLEIAERLGNAPDTPAVTITAYDANGSVMQVIGPAQRGGVGNHQTVTINDAFDSGQNLTHTGDFVLDSTFDGFDRVIEATDAVGNVQTNSYDPGARVVEAKQQGPIGGATPTNRNGTGNVDLTHGFMRFDEAGREYENQQEVFLATGTTLPSARAVTHTGGGLATNSTINNHTGTITLTSGGSTYVLTRTVYDRASRVVAQLEDNSGQTSAEYDGANRQIKQIDALQIDSLQNVVEFGFDANSNLTLTTQTERCTITQPTVADEVFRSGARYDSLNRVVVQVQQGADGSLDAETESCDIDPFWRDDKETLLSLTGYDSRSNETLSVDYKGNSAITEYDAASRITQVVHHLRERGQGSSPPAANNTLLPYGGASITTNTTYDGNSRVVQIVDDRGDVTTYEYDTLDRKITMIFHDGSTRSYEYNQASDVTRSTDENGSQFDNTFDALGRKTLCNITRASGVIGTTQQTFQYDGFSRLTKAIDSIGATSATVELFYDSLSRTLEDSQAYGGNTRNVTNSAFDSYPVSEFTFASGRKLDNTYDVLYRRTDISESGGSSIAAWEFFGPVRVSECTLGNGLIGTHMNNTRTRSASQPGQSSPGWGDRSSDRLGYDGTTRPISKRYLAGGLNPTTHAYVDTEAVVGVTTAYDKASNKFYERELHAESRSHLYEPFSTSPAEPEGGYDSIDRIRQYQRGVLSSTGGLANRGGGSVATPISLPNTDQSRTYDLDGLGNWRRTTFDPVGGAGTTSETRQHNKLNQIIRTDDGTIQTNYSYDGTSGASNGNLADDGIRTYEWDALNRLAKVYKTPASPVLIVEYTYDAFGRRIRKVVSNGGLSGNIANGTSDFLYASVQCVEERDGSNDPTKQYVWGTYVDELLQQRDDPDGTPADRFLLSDLLYRSVALTNSGGNIIEAYDTDAYGNTLIFTGVGTAGDWFADDAIQGDDPACPFLFTGRRYDAESELYFYRIRYYSSVSGRFLSRDPINSRFSLNLYEYVYGEPSKLVDPFGAAGYLPHQPISYLGSMGNILTRTLGDKCWPPANDAIDAAIRAHYPTAIFRKAISTIVREKGDPSKEGLPEYCRKGKSVGSPNEPDAVIFLRQIWVYEYKKVGDWNVQRTTDDLNTVIQKLNTCCINARRGSCRHRGTENTDHPVYVKGCGNLTWRCKLGQIWYKWDDDDGDWNKLFRLIREATAAAAASGLAGNPAAKPATGTQYNLRMRVHSTAGPMMRGGAAPLARPVPGCMYVGPKMPILK